MKNFLFCFLAGLALMLSSCSRSAITASEVRKSETSKHEISKATELEKAVTESLTEKSTIANDTLSAAIHFEPSDVGKQVTKTIESSGIEVTASLDKTETGGYTINIKGISKPRTGSERTLTRTETSKDNFIVTDTRSSDTKSERKEDKKKVLPLLERLPNLSGGYCCYLPWRGTSFGERLNTSC